MRILALLFSLALLAAACARTDSTSSARSADCYCPCMDGGAPDDGGQDALADAADSGAPDAAEVGALDAGPPPEPDFADGTIASGLSPLGCAPTWNFDVVAEQLSSPGAVDVVLGDHIADANQPRDAGVLGTCWARGSSAGLFTLGSQLPAPVTGVWAASAADYNGDGQEDVVPWFDSQSTEVWQNAGAGLGFAALRGSAVPFQNQGNGAAWADVDGDGLLDAASVDLSGYDLLQLGRGPGVPWSNMSSANVGTVGRATPVVHLADLNGDGWPDLVVQPFSSPTGGANGVFDARATHTTQVLFNKGMGPGASPVFAAPASVGLEGAPGDGMALGDLDGDGDLDVVAVGSLATANTAVGVRVFRNSGAGQFADATPGSGLSPDVAGQNLYVVLYYHVLLLDADSDGLLDVFWADGAAMHLFRNLGGMRFADVTAAAGLGATTQVARPVRVFAADVNSDGAEDLLVQRQTGGGGAGGGVTLYLNRAVWPGWLGVRAVGSAPKSAVGAAVAVYDAGHVGDPTHLRGYRQVLQGTSHRLPLLQHFGLAPGILYDVRVTFPDRSVRDALGAATGQVLTVAE